MTDLKPFSVSGNKLPDNIWLELWLDEKLHAKSTQMEITHLSEKPSGPLLGKIAFSEVRKGTDLRFSYILKICIEGEILNTRQFHFVGEDPDNLMDCHYVSCPVVSGQEYKFFARERKINETI